MLPKRKIADQARIHRRAGLSNAPIGGHSSLTIHPEDKLDYNQPPAFQFILPKVRCSFIHRDGPTTFNHEEMNRRVCACPDVIVFSGDSPCDSCDMHALFVDGSDKVMIFFHVEKTGYKLYDFDT